MKGSKRSRSAIYGTPTIVPIGLPEQIADHWSTKAIDTANKTLQVLGLKGSDLAGKYLDGTTLTKIGNEIEKGDYSKAADDLLRFAADKLIERIPVIGQLKVAYDLGSNASKWFKDYLKESDWRWLKDKVEKEVENETNMGFAEANAARLFEDLEASQALRSYIAEIGQKQYGYYNWMHVMTPRGRELAMRLSEEVKRRLLDVARAKAARNRLAQDLEKAHKIVKEREEK